MGYELLEGLLELLRSAGLKAGEAYPAGDRTAISDAVAAVGLRELDTAAGEARFTVRILSPRSLGGWHCQTQAAAAGAALRGGGLVLQTGEMEYLSGSDCFCITLTASQPVVCDGESWRAGSRWMVLCGDAEQEQVVSFRALRDQGRRPYGGLCRSEPHGVTPGTGGWTIELVQAGPAEPVEEPFELTVRRGSGEELYLGCCWNETELLHTQEGLRLTRRGFALSREVSAVE